MRILQRLWLIFLQRLKFWVGVSVSVTVRVRVMPSGAFFASSATNMCRLISEASLQPIRFRFRVRFRVGFRVGFRVRVRALHNLWSVLS